MERMKKEKKADQNAVAELTREGLYKENKWLWEENRKLKDSNTILKKGGQVVFTLEKRIDKLLEENKKLKEENKKLRGTIKDHQFYEEKLEHRIIEFEELLHGE